MISNHTDSSICAQTLINVAACRVNLEILYTICDWTLYHGAIFTNFGKVNDKCMQPKKVLTEIIHIYVSFFFQQLAR